MSKTKKKARTRSKTPAAIDAAPPPLPPKRAAAKRKRADAFKRFHIAVAIAPAFIEEYFLQGRREPKPDDYEALADAINELADAIAYRLDWS